MNNLMAVLARCGRRAAEIEAMRIAAALREAGDGDIKIERKGADVVMRARGLFRRLLHDPALRIAARWGK